MGRWAALGAAAAVAGSALLALGVASAYAPAHRAVAPPVASGLTVADVVRAELPARAAATASAAATTGAAPSAADELARVASATAWIRTRSGITAFAYVDETGRLYGYHAGETFVTASVVKAMLLVAYSAGARDDRGTSESDAHEHDRALGQRCGHENLP